MNTTKKEIYWTLFACTITHSFIHVFTFMHIALIPVFIEEFNLSIIQSALIASVPVICSILMSIPSGILADKIGHKTFMALSLLGSGISGLAVYQAKEFPTLLIALIFIDLSSTLYHPPSLSIVSELYPYEWRNRALGIHGAGGTGGIAIGPITLGLLMDRFGWRLAYLVWAFPVIVSSFMLLKIPKASKLKKNPSNQDRRIGSETEEEKNSSSTSVSEILTYGYVLLLLALVVKGTGDRGVSTYMTTFLVSYKDLTESAASLLFGLGSLLGIFGALSGGVLSDKIGTKRWITLAYAANMVTLLLIATTNSWLLLMVYLCYGFLGSSTLAATSSLVAEFSSKKRRGFAYSVFMFTFGLTGTTSPLIAAKIIELYDIWTLFPFAFSLNGIGILILQLLPKTKHEN